MVCNDDCGLYVYVYSWLHKHVSFSSLIFYYCNYLMPVDAFTSYAWLELVSHRSFMPKMLTGNSQKGWPYIQRLLVDMFQFMEPFLRNAELGPPVCPTHFFSLQFHHLRNVSFFQGHLFFLSSIFCRFIFFIKALLGCC